MSQSIKDLKKRTLFSKYQSQRLQWLALIHNLEISPRVRVFCVKQLNELPRNSSSSRFVNRCIITGRGRSVYRFCRLSRIKIRELASQGLLMGVRKSSW